jgi:hypothetical protein
MILNKKLLKRCGYLVVSLLLLQFFLYYTNKYRTEFIEEELKNAIKVHKEIKTAISQEKVSWENETFIRYEAERVGPGEFRHCQANYDLFSPPPSQVSKGSLTS